MSEAPRQPSSAPRYLAVLVVGLLIGIVTTVMLGRALQARRDPFPDSLMQVMSRQLQLLRDSQAQNRCSTADIVPRLQTLRALSNDLDLAFPGLRDDARFQQHASRFRATLNDAIAAPPADCAATATLNQQLEADCRACHQDFR
ncbi:hypothetical protein OK348_04525 [Flavobacterium sp. MXW15]|uniref:Cytochrome c n=1 Tax=Xanthomonas chitinilytica TaxID=2989819 RepID=A0ABT3JZ99_9XANT|nr:hypothetical protein [Xanthomonas sp. H13-6]MCW4454056.1 hypothetical protein [Flavobacterium sp. MXW15]MCW4473776.1 hypothetical protein [Xanthomonas sp. H13-6]